ncbi:MAG: IS1182 family transposase [Acetobacteraceae bacterium]|nr:IS1182 family transposase [Acetobacteraceae bacterium]
MKRFVTAGHPENQGWLLPPSVDEFVAQDAPVRLFAHVIDQLDLGYLRDAHKGGGRPAYDPVVMLKVLIFGMTLGIRSSRRLEDALLYDLRFKFLAHMATPDYRTIARFRAASESVLADVFVKTVRLARKQGLVSLEHVSVDGTKIAANAGKRQCRSAEELDAGIAKVDKIAAELLKEWKQNDERDATDNNDQSSEGDPPKRIRTFMHRKKRVEEAKSKLEESGDKTIIVTDDESRMIKTSGIIRPAYNAQAVVDADNQIIIAAQVCQDQADNAQLPPMMDLAKENTGVHPDRVSADGGYWSHATLDYVEREKLDAYIAPSGGVQEDLESWTYDATKNEFIGPDGLIYKYVRTESRTKTHGYHIFGNEETGKLRRFRQDHQKVTPMALKIRTPAGKAVYSKRKTIIEPVFGHLKGSYGMSRLLLRGLTGASVEFRMACIAHNIAKLVGKGSFFSSVGATKRLLYSLLSRNSHRLPTLTLRHNALRLLTAQMPT